MDVYKQPAQSLAHSRSSKSMSSFSSSSGCIETYPPTLIYKVEEWVETEGWQAGTAGSERGSEEMQVKGRGKLQLWSPTQR